MEMDIGSRERDAIGREEKMKKYAGQIALEVEIRMMMRTKRRIL
jgi:hypothetical protein